MCDLLRGEEIVPHRHRQGQVHEKHRRALGLVLGPLDLEVFRAEPNRELTPGRPWPGRPCTPGRTPPAGADKPPGGQAGPRGGAVEHALGHLPPDRIAHRPFDVQVERVAQLVRLGGVGTLVAHAHLDEPVPAEAVLREVLEQVLQRPLADSPKSFRRELEAAFPLLDETGLLEAPRQLLELRQRRGGVLAEEVPDPVEIDLGERARLGSPRQHLLELVEFAEALEHVRRLGHAESLAAAERHSPVPLLAREGRSEIARQPIDLPRRDPCRREARS